MQQQERPIIPKKVSTNLSDSTQFIQKSILTNTSQEDDDVIYRSPIESPKLTITESKLLNSKNLFNNDLYTNISNLNKNKSTKFVNNESPYLILTDMNNGLGEIRPKIPPKIRAQPVVIPTRPSFHTSDYNYCDDYISKCDDSFVNWCKFDQINEQLIEFNDYLSEIYSISGCNKCADCLTNNPTWISCLYMITLCSSCAQTHQNLFHQSNASYFFEINELFKHRSTRLLPIILLQLLKECGNEKINSLFDYESSTPNANKIENFIIEKYSAKKFTNKFDLQLCLEELDSNFIKNIQGNCLSLTIYSLALGANLYYVSENNETCLDAAIRWQNAHQYLYLTLIGAKKRVDLIDGHVASYEGSYWCQFFNGIHYVYSALLSTQCLMLKCSSTSYTDIRITFDLSSIVRILNEEFFEILSINSFNSSILKQNFSILYESEREKWMRLIVRQLILRNCPNLFTFFNRNRQTCIKIFGLLDFSYTNDDFCEANVFLLIDNDEYKRDLVIITTDIEIIDLRKLTKMKKNFDKLIISYENRVVYFKSNGYADNAQVWFETIEKYSKIDTFESLEQNYLTKNDIPLLMDKCFFFIQVNQRDLLKINHSNIDELYEKLLSDKDFTLISSIEYEPSIILNVIRKFCEKNFKFPLELIRLFKNNLDDEHLSVIKRALEAFAFKNNRNKVIYSNIRFIFIQYHLMKLNSVHEIDNFFKELLFENGDSHVFDILSANFQHLFDVSDSYLTKEQEIIEKSISLRRLSGIFTQNNLSFLVTIYLHSNQSDEYIQININTAPKVYQILEDFKLKFDLQDSLYWCLTEISLETSLERILPVNSIFFDSTSKWSNKFYHCVKLNQIQLEFKVQEISETSIGLDLSSDECSFKIVDSILNEAMAQFKWKKCNLSLNKSRICIYKRTDSYANALYSSRNSSKIDFNIELPQAQLNIEDSIIYFCESNTSVLTIYHLNDKKFYLIKYPTQLDAYKWYFNLFKLKYHQDSWSYFKKDLIPSIDYKQEQQHDVKIHQRSTLLTTSSLKNEFKRRFTYIFNRFS